MTNSTFQTFFLIIYCPPLSVAHFYHIKTMLLYKHKKTLKRAVDTPVSRFFEFVKKLTTMYQLFFVVGFKLV